MDKDTLENYRKLAEENSKVSKRLRLTKKEKRYLKKYGPQINILCCKHERKHSMLYQIGYIGLPCCKVAICVDCGERQILGCRFCKWLLKRFIKKGVTRINIIDTISFDDVFMYR